MPRPTFSPPAKPKPVAGKPKPLSKPRIALPEPEGPLDLDSSVSFLPSGSTQLDKILGGGWAMGRISNLVGDKSTGKSLLAIEACANFAIRYAVEDGRYGEAEAAFDEAYAANIGMPEGITRPDDQLETVEEFDKDLQEFLERRSPKDGPCFYVLDSLDALSDVAELARKVGEGSYGTEKAKYLSRMFRKRVRLIADRQCHLLIISQLRDKLNAVAFGEQKTRSGGKALDFYASQIVWLAEKGKIKRKVLGNDRVVGADIRARAKKNKVGIPFRECDFRVIFSYGVDDELSMLDWIAEQKIGAELALGLEGTIKQVVAARKAEEYDILDDLREDIIEVFTKRWNRIEAELRPTIRKYRREAE